MDKGEDGVYTVNDFTYASMDIDGSVSVSAYPNSYILDLDGEADVALAKVSFFYAGGFSYAGSEIVESALEDSATEYYLNSDGILSIKGSVSEETSVGSTEIPTTTISYDYVIQYDAHGLLTYYETSGYTVTDSSYSVSGSIKFVGDVGGSVEHKKFYDTVKESQPSGSDMLL